MPKIYYFFYGCFFVLQLMPKLKTLFITNKLTALPYIFDGVDYF
jgi:hypothetical protein